MTLWHYTCDHGHALIGGRVIPGVWQTDRVAGGPGEYAWFTDLAYPHRGALGLTSHILACDRTAHRYRATLAASIVPWVTVRRDWAWAEELESAPGAMPKHWYVSPAAVPVVYDPISVGVAS